MLKIIMPFLYFNFSFKYLTLLGLMLIPILISNLNFHIHTIHLLNFNLFMDPMNTPLILLTTWLMSMMIMASKLIKMKNLLSKEFIMNISSLSVILIFAFSVNNLMMYYILFEASLIPTLMLILGWGYQPERLQAGMYLMLYTISASLPLLMSLMFIYNNYNSLFMFSHFKNLNMSVILILFLMLAFLVKMPLYISHLWLPKAHVEAPVAGSMVLAGILLKLGAYGMLRMMFLIPFISLNLGPFFFSISLWGAVATAMICLRQQDMKSLIAYSSVGHMALLIAGMYSNMKWGWEGSISMMIAHGLSSSCLFALANSYYEYTNTRSILLSKGFLILFPNMAMWWFIMNAANMAAPPTLNLMSEILLLTSILTKSITTTPFLMTTAFLSAAYSLVLYTSLHHGAPNTNNNMMMSNFQNNIIVSLLHFLPLYTMITTSIFLISWQ